MILSGYMSPGCQQIQTRVVIFTNVPGVGGEVKRGPRANLRMIAIIELGLCQNYQTTPLFRLYSTPQGNITSAAQEPRSYR